MGAEQADAWDNHTEALLAAAQKGDVKKVRALLAKGARVNAGHFLNGHTALHVAGRHPEVVEVLLRAGASPHVKIKYASVVHEDNQYLTGETPLHWAAVPKVIALLLEAGADRKARSARGLSVLHTAAKMKHGEAIAAFVAAGCDINGKDKLGLTPLHWASGHLKTQRAILAQGADVNAKDSAKRTPLHDAVARGGADGIAALIEAGADVNAVNAEGRTPLHDAIREVANVKLLVEAGADPKKLDKMKQPPATYARVLGCNATLNYLSSLGKGKKKAPALPERLDWTAIESALYAIAAKGLAALAKKAKRPLSKVLFSTNAAYGELQLEWCFAGEDDRGTSEIDADRSYTPHKNLIAQQAESSSRVTKDFLTCVTKVFLRLEGEGALDKLDRAKGFSALVVDHDESEAVAARRLKALRKTSR